MKDGIYESDNARYFVQNNEDKYPSSVNAIKKALKYNELWSRLTVSEVRDFITFTDDRVFEVSYVDWAFGTKFLQDE